MVDIRCQSIKIYFSHFGQCNSIYDYISVDLTRAHNFDNSKLIRQQKEHLGIFSENICFCTMASVKVFGWNSASKLCFSVHTHVCLSVLCYSLQVREPPCFQAGSDLRDLVGAGSSLLDQRQDFLWNVVVCQLSLLTLCLVSLWSSVAQWIEHGTHFKNVYMLFLCPWTVQTIFF